MQTGALELDPNPIWAVDGDSGLNEKIVYSIISGKQLRQSRAWTLSCCREPQSVCVTGNDAGVFEIDSSTGSITMQKPVTTQGTITLRVLVNTERCLFHSGCGFPAAFWGGFISILLFHSASQANQEVNVHQFAVTSVSIAVLARSAHKPQFPMSLYEGIITTMGTMAENKNDVGTLLRILATDEDYGPEVELPFWTLVYGNQIYHTQSLFPVCVCWH